MTSVFCCKGKTTKGKPCKNPPQGGSPFCRYHEPEKSQLRERKLIKEFFKEHREGVMAFLAGAAADPVASDIYDFVKEQLGMKHLVPPVKEESLEELCGRWQNNRDALTLLKILPHLKIGISDDYVRLLLGEPLFGGGSVETSRFKGTIFIYDCIMNPGLKSGIFLVFDIERATLESLTFHVETINYNFSPLAYIKVGKTYR